MTRVSRLLIALLISASPQFFATHSATAEQSTSAAACLVSTTTCVPNKFIKEANSKALANPAILVTDPLTNAALFENRPDSPSIPASVMKLVTSYTALTFLGGERRFTTSIYQIETSTTLLIVGERDPWLTMYRSVSEKYGPAYAPDLISKAIKQISPEASPKKVEIKFSKLYSSDIEGLKAHFKAKKIKLSFIEVTSEEAKSLATQPIHQIISPSVNAMVSFLIRFSDNRLADRLSVHATLAHGYADTERGRQETYQDALLSRQIGIDGLKVVDGSGLSKENRVTSRLIVDLLTKIRAVPEFEAIYQGLPKSGKSGTLKTRFKKTAPDAVGLIKAKTGWVNGTVSLAGYITAGNREYAFAVLADRIPRYYSATERARASIDRMVGSLAQAKVIPTSQQ